MLEEDEERSLASRVFRYARAREHSKRRTVDRVIYDPYFQGRRAVDVLSKFPVTPYNPARSQVERRVEVRPPCSFLGGGLILFLPLLPTRTRSFCQRNLIISESFSILSPFDPICRSICIARGSSECRATPFLERRTRETDDSPLKGIPISYGLLLQPSMT